MKTAVAADEPEPRRRYIVEGQTLGPDDPRRSFTAPAGFAVGGIVRAGTQSWRFGECDGAFPVDRQHTDAAGNVHVTFTVPPGKLADAIRGPLGPLSLGFCPNTEGAP